MQNFDLHMHTSYCDGRDTAEDMIKAAAELGLDTVGLSGHSFTPHDQSYCMSREGTERYIGEITSLKEKYADKIRVLLGLELDYYADTDTSPYDYLIGSVHYLFTEEGLRKQTGDLVKFTDWTPVDDAAEEIQIFADTLGCGIMDVAELYYETEADIIRRTDCDIIGHFDLITKFNTVDTDDPRYIKAWKVAVDRIFEDCRERYAGGYRNRLEKAGLIEAGDKPVFEINHGAIAKGYKTEPYPDPGQIAYIKSKGGIFVCSSDAHKTEHIQYWCR